MHSLRAAHLLWLLCLRPPGSAAVSLAAPAGPPPGRRAQPWTPEQIRWWWQAQKEKKAAARAAARPATREEKSQDPGFVPAIEDVPPAEQTQFLSMPLPRRSEHSWTAAVYLQVGNPRLWSEMANCAEAVGNSTTLQHVDLFISSFEPLPELEERLKRYHGFRQVYFQRVENMGADVGQFLQQLGATQTMTQGRGTDSDYDLLLKMHTKTDENWRGSALDDLCGSREEVDKVVRYFQTREGLGMLGPEGLVFRPLGRYGGYFNDDEVAAMRQVWQLMMQKPMPEDRTQWSMSAGSFFWARAGFFLGDAAFREAIPKLLRVMPRGYKTGSCCMPPHGLERVLPTWMSWRGYSVLSVRNHQHDNLITTYRHFIDMED